MKINLFLKKAVGLFVSLFFSISGAFAMTHEETHVPPDEYLYECESDIKIFKSVDKYFDWVGSQNLPRIMIVGSGRGDNGYRKRWAKLVYGEREYNYFLVNIDPFFYPDRIKDVTKNLTDLRYGEWDFVITEYVCPFIGPPAGASEVFKLLKSGGKIIKLDGTGTSSDYTNRQPINFMDTHFWLGDTPYLVNLDKNYAFVRALNIAAREYPGYEAALNFFTKYKWDGTSHSSNYIQERDELLQNDTTARSEYLRACFKLNSNDVQSVRLLTFNPSVTHDIGGEAIETYLNAMKLFRRSVKYCDDIRMVVITKK